MYNSKFLVLFRTLNKKELREFNRYLYALHARKTILLKIYDYIRKLPWDSNIEKWDKKLLHDQLFGAEKYQERKITDTISDLHLLLKEFLIKKEMEQDEFIRDYLFFWVLKNRKLDREYVSKLEKANARLTKTNGNNGWHSLKQFLLNHEHFYHHTTNKLKAEVTSLKECMYNLDNFFIFYKMKLSAEMLSRKNIVKERNEIHLLSETLGLVEKHEEFAANPLHQIYFLLLRLFDSHERKIFNETKQLVLDNINVLSKVDLHILILYLINFSASEIKKGQSHYFAEVFVLYEQGLALDAFIEDDLLPSTRFVNIVDVACQLKRFGWVEKFIEKWSSSLDVDWKEDTLKMSRARLLFAKGKFEETIEELSVIKYKNAYFGLRVKYLLIRCFVELEEPADLIIDYCTSFEVYIKRNKVISDETKKAYRNFIKLIRDLVKVKSKKTKPELLRKLNALKFIVCKDWLIEQINKKE